jgi:hypothetical protein
MTSKEKATQLIDKYKEYTNREIFDTKAKECALIVVDEILDTLYYNYYDINNGTYEYWEDVKKEIKNA